MVAIVGTGDVVAPLPTLVGFGAINSDSAGEGTLLSTRPVVSGIGAVGPAGGGSLLGIPPVITGIGQVGFRGTGVLSAPLPSISGVGFLLQAITGTGNILAPLPTLLGVGLVPDSSIWDNNDQEWGQADVVHSEAKPIMLVGIEFYQADNGVLYGDLPIEVTLSRTGLTIVGRDRFGQWTVDPGVIKLVSGIWPIIRANPGTIVQIWAGAQDSPDDPITWEGPYDFTVGIDSFQDFADTSGRYVAIRFTSVGQLPWELLSYDLDIVPIGERRNA